MHLLDWIGCFSNLPAGVRADPGCELQQLAEPAGAPPTSWYMQEYARDGKRWLADFTAALDKMQSNGYPAGLVAGPDQITAVQCSPRCPDCWYSQCSLVAGATGQQAEQQFWLQSQLDGQVLRWDAAQARLVMAAKEDNSPDQLWRLTDSSIFNVHTGQPLRVRPAK